MPIAIAVGQAAGTAAALCAGSGASPRRLDPAALRATLVAQGANIFHHGSTEGKEAQKDKEVRGHSRQRDASSTLSVPKPG